MALLAHKNSFSQKHHIEAENAKNSYILIISYYTRNIFIIAYLQFFCQVMSGRRVFVRTGDLTTKSHKVARSIAAIGEWAECVRVVRESLAMSEDEGV
jgi:hypothetical protein